MATKNQLLSLLYPWPSNFETASQKMERFEKLVERLLSRPKDFTWTELQTIMRKFGYTEKKAKGSGRKFVNAKTGHILSLHKPHPSKILKPYAIEIIINKLIESGII